MVRVGDSNLNRDKRRHNHHRIDPDIPSYGVIPLFIRSHRILKDGELLRIILAQSVRAGYEIVRKWFGILHRLPELTGNLHLTIANRHTVIATASDYLQQEDAEYTNPNQNHWLPALTEFTHPGTLQGVEVVRAELKMIAC
jgi:hypothetical protein